MKVKELKPILEVLDENIEVEFTIVSRQEPPKNELRDNYRTCGVFTFGHATNIEDSDGLTVTCWPIYDSEGLIGFLRQTNIRSFCNKNQARTKGSGCWQRLSIYNGQLLKAIGEFLCEEYEDGRDEFHVLFTQELERFIVEKGLSDNKKKLIRECYVGIVPLVYFVK